MRIKAALALTLMAAAPACHAQQASPPLTNGQATKAMRTLMGMNQIEAVLGTCKPATHAEFKGQTACTLVAVSSGGTSETQADFHWNGKGMGRRAERLAGRSAFPGSYSDEYPCREEDRPECGGPIH